MAANLIFIPETHTYLKEGIRVASVTQILEAGGLVCYEGIPDAVLNHKADVGRAVHAATHYYDEGTLNWPTVDDEVLGYLEGWEKFRAETGFVISKDGIEHRGIATLTGMEYGYTFDRDGLLNSRPTLLELKCTAGVEISWGPQTAAYEHALRQKDGRGRHRVVVHLRPNGTYSLYSYTDPKDYQIFGAALLLESWKKSRGKNYGYGSNNVTR